MIPDILLKPKIRRVLFMLFGFAAFSFVLCALFLQHFMDVASCPLCVLQRYVFIVLGLACVIGALFNKIRLTAFLGVLVSLVGVGVSGWQIWTKRTVTFGCGIDSLEAFVNSIPLADIMPYVFRASGDCAKDNFELFFLTLPTWSLISFLGFIFVFTVIGFSKTRSDYRL